MSITEVVDDALSPEAEKLINAFIKDGLDFELSDDDPNEVHALEIDSQATKVVRSCYNPYFSNAVRYALTEVHDELPRPRHIGSQFARRIVPAILADEDTTAWEQFCELEPTTEDQNTVLSTNQEQFIYLRNTVNDHLQVNLGTIRGLVDERFEKEGSNGHKNKAAFHYNDVYQFKLNETRRSLANLVLIGLTVRVDTKGLAIIEEIAANQYGKAVPIIELTKNWPILTINGFEDSKLSLAVHDAIDHIWTFNLAESKGLFTKYQTMFNSIGDPAHTDIFKREGEILASISFGTRYWEFQDGFVPILTTSFIANHLQSLAMAGKLQEKHQAALNILNQITLDPSSNECRSLGFVFSNYLSTLHEQRRRYGRIKQKSLLSNQTIGELNPLDPDFLSFFVELHHQLMATSSEYKQALMVAHVRLEEYLASVGEHRHQEHEELVLAADQLTGDELSRVRLPDCRIEWLRDHYQFTTIKEQAF